MKPLSFTSSILISVSVLLKIPWTTSSLLPASYMWGTILSTVYYLPFHHFWNLVSQIVKSYDKVGGVFEDRTEVLSHHSGARESRSAGRRQVLQHGWLQLQVLSPNFTCTSFTRKSLSTRWKQWVILSFWTVVLWHQFISIIRLPKSCFTVFIFH